VCGSAIIVKLVSNRRIYAYDKLCRSMGYIEN